MKLPILVLLACLTAPLALGADVPVGGRLPDLSIAERGELVISGDDVDYRTWSYPQQPGKVHVLQYLAATRAASNINKPFTDRMKTDLPKGSFLSTTILNLDEAVWGTAGLVVSELKSNKRDFPNAVLVADEDGAGLQQWQLEKESSAIIVTDPAGVVRYFKQGPMSAAEIDSTLELVRQYIAGGAPPVAAAAAATSGH
ncbi:MAG: YtfJ family protein [Gammaproteobacteria bacterium]|nr:YtfJ family protein [Gammaproteobacteria bacterium]